MPRKKKVVLEPAGNDLKQFQAKYGEVWRQIVDNPAYQAGVQFLRNKKLEQLAQYSDEHIDKYSRHIMGELRGYLQHEIELLKLHEMTDFTLPFEEETEYLSPEQEAEMQQLRSKFREETKKQRYA